LVDSVVGCVEKSPVNSLQDRSRCRYYGRKPCIRSWQRKLHLFAANSEQCLPLITPQLSRLGYPNKDKKTNLPRVVTDVSPSNRTDSAVSNPNTSGSGSAGNSGNDSKGSSEDRVKEDNSGGGTNEGSDGVGSEGLKEIALGVDNILHRHDTALSEQPSQAALDDLSMKGTNGLTRERKLIDKKRKRIEMRREYEAQQQFESSASSESKGDHLLRPGKAVSMDEVLSLSKIPR
jgi:hypothetical protein